MRKIIPLLVVVSILFFTENLIAQDELEFIETRQEMADNLTSVKTAARDNDWGAAQNNFNKAKYTWQNEVKPLLIEDEKTERRFLEYFGRMDEVEEHLSKLAQLLEGKKEAEIESQVNAIIWGISHHPRGFEVGPPKYSVWDWVFGLGIGLGWCVFATFFGLYLRRSYYRRYAKQSGM